MNLFRKPAALGLLACAAVAAPAALAQQPPAGGWYGGASIGRSAATIDDARIRTALTQQGLGPVTIEDRDRTTGYKVFGGYQLHRNFAVEAGYIDLGRFGYDARPSSGSLSGQARLQGINIDLVATLPLAGRLSALGRIGVASIRARDRFVATAPVRFTPTDPSQRDSGLKLGAGLVYSLTDAVDVRLDAERYRANDAIGNHGHVDLVSIGFVYRFGVPPQ